MNLISLQEKFFGYLNSGLQKELGGIMTGTQRLNLTRKNQWKPVLATMIKFFGSPFTMQKASFQLWLIHFMIIQKQPTLPINTLLFSIAVHRKKILLMFL